MGHCYVSGAPRLGIDLRPIVMSDGEAPAIGSDLRVQALRNRRLERNAFREERRVGRGGTQQKPSPFRYFPHLADRVTRGRNSDMTTTVNCSALSPAAVAAPRSIPSGDFGFLGEFRKFRSKY